LFGDFEAHPIAVLIYHALHACAITQACLASCSAAGTTPRVGGHARVSVGPSSLIGLAQVALELGRRDDSEALGNALHFLPLKPLHALLFIVDDGGADDGVRVGLIHEVVHAVVVQSHIVVADPAVVQVVKLFIIMHLLFLTRVADCAALGRGLAILCTGGAFVLLLLLGGLTLFAIVCLPLMATILLDGGERVVQLDARHHRLDEVLEAMASSDVARLRVVLRAADVFLV